MSDMSEFTLPYYGRGRNLGWRGIDRTRNQSKANPNSFWDTTDTEITAFGRAKRRAGLRVFAQVDERSVGLYSVGGWLRCAYVSRPDSEWASTPPSGVRYDAIGTNDAWPEAVDYPVDVTGIETWDADEDFGPFPYIVIKNKFGNYDHHWITGNPPAADIPVDTKIDLGFLSGPSILKDRSKIYGFDWYNGHVHYSSAYQGPTVWRPNLAPGDAGYFAPSKHAQGDVRLKTIQFHQGNMLCVFDNAIQNWTVSVDEQQIRYNHTLSGPGTRFTDSFQPVIGDVLYYSEGGFESLATQTVTGELRPAEFGIGSFIFDLTQKFNDFDVEAVKSLWSPARGEYLCAFNSESSSEVFCYAHYPTLGTGGWTRWNLPIRVDNWCAHGGRVFIRSGRWIYVLDDDLIFDEIEGVTTDFEAVVDMQFHDFGRPSHLKTFFDLTTGMEGETDIDLLMDDRDRDTPYGTFTGVKGLRGGSQRMTIGVSTNRAALRFRARKAFELEDVTFRYKLLRGFG